MIDIIEFISSSEYVTFFANILGTLIGIYLTISGMVVLTLWLVKECKEKL